MLSPYQVFRHRRGFSFTEVIFAVVILGIGFIMTASIFPVAIEQTRSNADEAVAAGLSRDLVNCIASSVHADVYAAADPGGTNAGVTQPFSSSQFLYPEVVGSLIDNSDPRYACVPFFCESAPNGTVKVIVLVVRRWVRDAYTPADLDADLAPQNINVNSITRQSDGTGVIEISCDPVSDPQGYSKRVAPGTFVVISNFNSSEPSGRAFRVTSIRSQTNESVFWNLDPSAGLLPGESFGSDGGAVIKASVIGRDLLDPTNPDGGYTGPSQDVGIFTTFLRPE
jgi:prepilin-type N-terminal cleavage/methylation domain-containing protein